MHHVIVVVSNHGTLWRYFPLAARQGTDRVYFFFDHRHTPQERQTFMRAYVPIGSIERMEVISHKPTLDCAGGVHLWQPVIVDEVMVAARCDLCARTDYLEDPLTAQVTIQHELAHAG